MPTFLILKSESQSGPKAGRGTRGNNLAQFLKKYYGSRSVSLISVDDIHSRSPQSLCADHLFIGIPSPLDKTALARIRYDKVHLFDYYDLAEAYWGDSDQDFLRNLTATYLKPWTESHWDNSFDWGCLPIRRYPHLPIFFRMLKAIGSHPMKRKHRPVDTAFLGSPFITWREQYDGLTGNPRIEWLRQIADHEAYTYVGGLAVRDGERELVRSVKEDDSWTNLIYRGGRQGFPTYFHQMTQAKTALTPPGNARWTYRHYESIYAGAIPITSDFRNADMLVPLPTGGMAHVESGSSVLPALELALKLRRDTPELPAKNFACLEQYMTLGTYDRRKTKLLDRFLSQL